jgi:hypothetical protein
MTSRAGSLVRAGFAVLTNIASIGAVRLSPIPCVVRTRSPGSKEATVKTFHHDDLESLKTHVFTFVTAYDFAKHLKALKWKTPFQNAGAGAMINVSMGIESGSAGKSLKKECADRAIRALVTRGFLLPDIQLYFSEVAGVPCVAYMGDRRGNAVYPKTGQHNPRVNQMPGLTGGIGQSGPRGVADQQYDGTHRFFGNPKCPSGNSLSL